MDNRSGVLINNYKKAVYNLQSRIYTYNTENNEKYIEIIRESIAQTNEICVELAWKTARALCLVLEPTINIGGSNTAIKQALKFGVIKDETLARGILSAIQNRNLSSHEYLLDSAMEGYIDVVMEEYFPVYMELLDEFEEFGEE
ncbi:MAG: nucleotidyltransferase substrate binding protein [Lachnospirales bacterium]